MKTKKLKKIPYKICHGQNLSLKEFTSYLHLEPLLPVKPGILREIHFFLRVQKALPDFFTPQTEDIWLTRKDIYRTLFSRNQEDYYMYSYGRKRYRRQIIKDREFYGGIWPRKRMPSPRRAKNIFNLKEVFFEDFVNWLGASYFDGTDLRTPSQIKLYRKMFFKAPPFLYLREIQNAEILEFPYIIRILRKGIGDLSETKTKLLLQDCTDTRKNGKPSKSFLQLFSEIFDNSLDPSCLGAFDCAVISEATLMGLPGLTADVAKTILGKTLEMVY